MARKVNKNYLKRLVKQVIAEERQARKPKKKATRHQLRLAESLVRAKMLIEQDQAQGTPEEEDVPAEVSDAADAQAADQGESGGGDPAAAAAAVAGTSASTDINSMSPEAIADAMLSGVDNDLYGAIDTATGWASKPLGKLGAADAAGKKAVAVQMFGGGDEAAARAAIIQRVGEVNTKLSQSQGFSKDEMPALEGVDVNALQDALNSQTGDLGVDASASYKDDEAGFEDWYAENPGAGEGESGGDTGEEQGDQDDEEVQAAGHRRSGGVLLERWGQLAGLQPLNALREISSDERFPFPGPASVMDGAPNLGDDGSIDPGAIKGKAKAFLTKGKGTDGDAFNINQNQGLSNSAMKPTQTNIKVGKSMLFALGDIGADMEGAFATSDGEILDGHHRWSGQYLRTGGEVEMTNIHLIDKGGMATPEFLTMLTVVGNALGRPTKLK
jgi:hypothetical protein